MKIKLIEVVKTLYLVLILWLCQKKTVEMSNKEDSKVNISTAPDYAQLAKANSNTAIIEFALKSMGRDGLGLTNMANLTGQVIIALVLKSAIENSTIDKFKLTDIMFLKYFYQKIKYGEKTFEIVKIMKNPNDKQSTDKYLFGNIELNIGMTNSFFAQKAVHVERPGIYYYSFSGFHICVNVTESHIKIKVPQINKIIVNFDTILSQMTVHVQANKTVMLRMGISPTGYPTVTPIRATYAYETKNYTELRKTIHSVFNTSSRLNQPRKPIFVVFNGAPGMGKTTFGNFIASLGEAHLVINSNMIQFIKHNTFSDIVSKIDKQINTTMENHREDTINQKVVIVFDELDKYYKGFCEFKISKIQEEAKKGLEVTNKRKEGDDSTSIRYPEKLSEAEISTKMMEYKNDILNMMYQIAEGISPLGNERQIVIICNMNHYDEFVEGVDKSFDALKQRIIKFQFNKMTKAEVINFLKDMRRRLSALHDEDIKKIESNIEYDPASIIDPETFNVTDEDLESIPNDITISFRVLNDKIISISKYDLRVVVKRLHDKSNWDDDSSYVVNKEN